MTKHKRTTVYRYGVSYSYKEMNHFECLHCNGKWDREVGAIDFNWCPFCTREIAIRTSWEGLLTQKDARTKEQADGTGEQT